MQEVECLGIGSTWVAVATSLQYVRMFSYTGLQKCVLDIASSPDVIIER